MISRSMPRDHNRILFIIVVIFSFYAFSPQVHSMGNDEIDKANPPVTSYDTTFHQLIRSRYTKYKSWWSSHVAPFSKISGLEAGKVTEDEITMMRRCVQVSFPGTAFDDNEISLTVKVKNHITGSLGIRCNESDRNRAYSEWFQADIGMPLPSKDEIAPLLEILALFENIKVKETVDEINNETENRTEKELNSAQFWKHDDLLLDLPYDQCLAQHRDSTHCQLSVGRFNAMVKHFNIMKFIPLDTARKIIIKNILTDDYICSDAVAKGYTKNDSIEQLKSKWLANAAYKSNFKGIFSPFTDEDLISRAYEKYYDLFFARTTKKYYSIIGSNDSLFIDSIWMRLSSDSLHESPWSYSSTDEMPIEFISYSDSLSVGKYTPPIATPFGFYIVRLDSIVSTPEISYYEGHKKATLIASRQKWHNLDSLVLSKAQYIFNEKKYFKNVYDTLGLDYILFPKATGNTTRHYTDSLLTAYKNQLLHFDARSSPIRSSELSRIGASFMSSIHSAPVDSLKIIGPFESPFGIWFFKKRSHRKSEMKRSFTDVRMHLIDSLLIDEIDLGEGLKYLEPDSLTERFALARVHSKDFYSYQKKLPERTDSLSQIKNNGKIISENRLVLNSWLGMVDFLSY